VKGEKKKNVADVMAMMMIGNRNGTRTIATPMPAMNNWNDEEDEEKR